MFTLTWIAEKEKRCVTKFDDLVLQNSVVVVQNKGSERQKACCTCKFVFLLIRKKLVLHVQFV